MTRPDRFKRLIDLAYGDPRESSSPVVPPHPPVIVSSSPEKHSGSNSAPNPQNVSREAFVPPPSEWDGTSIPRPDFLPAVPVLNWIVFRCSSQMLWVRMEVAFVDFSTICFNEATPPHGSLTPEGTMVVWKWLGSRTPELAIRTSGWINIPSLFNTLESEYQTTIQSSSPREPFGDRGALEYCDNDVSPLVVVLWILLGAFALAGCLYYFYCPVV